MIPASSWCASRAPVLAAAAVGCAIEQWEELEGTRIGLEEFCNPPRDGIDVDLRTELDHEA